MTKQTMGARLRKLRSIAGLTTRELAQLAGLASAGHVSMLESGERADRVAARTAIDLARVLGVSVPYLVDGTGTRPGDVDIVDAATAAKEASK